MSTSHWEEKTSGICIGNIREFLLNTLDTNDVSEYTLHNSVFKTGTRNQVFRDKNIFIVAVASYGPDFG